MRNTPFDTVLLPGEYPLLKKDPPFFRRSLDERGFCRLIFANLYVQLSFVLRKLDCVHGKRLRARLIMQMRHEGESYQHKKLTVSGERLSILLSVTELLKISNKNQSEKRFTYDILFLSVSSEMHLLKSQLGEKKHFDPLSIWPILVCLFSIQAPEEKKLDTYYQRNWIGVFLNVTIILEQEFRFEFFLRNFQPQR